jgi:hypothetical protein
MKLDRALGARERLHRVTTDVVLRRVSHLRNSAPQRREEQATGALAEALRRAGLAVRRK